MLHIVLNSVDGRIYTVPWCKRHPLCPWSSVPKVKLNPMSNSHLAAWKEITFVTGIPCLQVAQGQWSQGLIRHWVATYTLVALSTKTSCPLCWCHCEVLELRSLCGSCLPGVAPSRLQDLATLAGSNGTVLSHSCS